MCYKFDRITHEIDMDARQSKPTLVDWERGMCVIDWMEVELSHRKS